MKCGLCSLSRSQSLIEHKDAEGRRVCVTQLLEGTMHEFIRYSVIAHNWQSIASSSRSQMLTNPLHGNDPHADDELSNKASFQSSFLVIATTLVCIYLS